MQPKPDYRKHQLARLKAAAPETQAAGPALLATLMTLPEWQQARTIATTVASPIEVPTAPLIQAALAAGKQVFLPKTMPHRQMAFLPDPGPAARITSPYGIPEPAYAEAQVNNQVDLVIVPGIAYALDTHARLGFGGGYYDRFLAQYRGATVTLAAPVMALSTAAWPIEATDVLLQTVITRTGIHRL
ncbi:5-formyltetrahydrofolate cyclo-ligase [Lacticaseibacillus daqingensis]|uniref:5-formyltetrahydrofolate cyclo-ligase n=1 Tax=Lacticaseibacillus daqingensis TaxID=2486014 RepID=UPI000F7941BB|nr:5-formyltetrahydrofolate cyclo-ligase [Lacticaseibacillus daqingensis]